MKLGKFRTLAFFLCSAALTASYVPQASAVIFGIVNVSDPAKIIFDRSTGQASYTYSIPPTASWGRAWDACRKAYPQTKSVHYIKDTAKISGDRVLSSWVCDSNP
ncbi:hypothetical protein H2Y54_09100 [Pectobacterium aroidearum]|uniref:hypothetical protein n=1 Tax=Pectobacterium aroidearum TaxID=1201031 RepID=UPI0015F10310|nr:hypothetical protein [Pectobacterium aroidearum]MBA5236706.1 hypothetical protein [Pectobacterium aroidearum]